jgi:hypothetical protein
LNRALDGALREKLFAAVGTKLQFARLGLVAAIASPERARRRVQVLALFAAAMAASASAPILESTVPWWERITVTVDEKGEQQLCRYETSLSPTGAAECDTAMAASVKSRSEGPSGTYSKITYERRFSPGGQLDSGKLRPGDTLLGRQVLFLTFNPAGAIQSCQVVATSGELQFQYNCDAAKKEQFRAQARMNTGARQAFMTILAYSHTEYLA